MSKISLKWELYKLKSRFVTSLFCSLRFISSTMDTLGQFEMLEQKINQFLTPKMVLIGTIHFVRNHTWTISTAMKLLLFVLLCKTKQ